MQPQLWYHYCSFVTGVYILCQDSISEADLLQSEMLLQYFVYMMGPLYGERYLTLNVHSLLHLSDVVRNLGPLWCHSSFPFENANGQLLKLFHGTQYVDIQIINTMKVLQKLPVLINMLPLESPSCEFVKSLVHAKKEKCDGALSFLGKRYTHMLSDIEESQVIRILGLPIHSIAFYHRVFLHSVQVYHSKSYARVNSRNCYTVKYFDIENQVRYGFIMWFAKLENQSGEEHTLCCISRLIPSDIDLVEPDVNGHDSNRPINVLNMKITHIKVMQTDSVFTVSDVIPITNIVSQCVCIRVDANIFVCNEANNMELNL